VSRLPLLLVLSAVVLSASELAIPGAVEMKPGLFILKGGATPLVYPALKCQHITHLLDLRQDGEIAPGSAFQMTMLQEMKVHFMRYSTDRAPSRADLDFIRALLNHFPKGSRIVVVCNNGNRAAGVVCPWLVLDQGLPLEEALAASRLAGLQVPETEAAVRGYLEAYR
jgi:rhodanese-related sulfurtransferase